MGSAVDQSRLPNLGIFLTRVKRILPPSESLRKEGGGRGCKKSMHQTSIGPNDQQNLSSLQVPMGALAAKRQEWFNIAQKDGHKHRSQAAHVQHGRHSFQDWRLF